MIGAEGGIGGTYGVMPELFLKIDELINAENLARAKEVQYTVNAIIAKMCSGHGNMYGMIKAFLNINEGLELGDVRKPLASLIESDRPIVEEAAKMIQDAREKY